ncbi:hypothetical protein [Kosakonia sacchari]|uniref:hypothetical protein n=1 Tax=Kosakonia sacchari TaxID=1158459 RepID=UPI0015848140|nr:hypothetical protein [Kosakonia sacchari]NUL35094.1 hypothetical protein [Kosakonia sacchari]
MKLKVRIVSAIGLSRHAPRWLKIMCFQVVMDEVARSIESMFKGADFSKLTQEDRDELQKAIDKLNLARGRGIKA